MFVQETKKKQPFWSERDWDTNANEDVNEAKGVKDAPNWLKKASQNNIEANCDNHCSLNESTKETTRRELMS